MQVDGRTLIIDCSVYGDICHAPAYFNADKYDKIVFKMESIPFIQTDELTHLRCLFELASVLNLEVVVHPPRKSDALRYAEGMGLFTGFNTPGIKFPNGKESSYIPLTRVNSDWNGYLFEDFKKIFERMHLPESSIPQLCLAFTEIADNIYYHSGYTDNTGWGYLAAQVYKTRVLISFTDVGAGIMNAYIRSGTSRGRTNLELVKDSLNLLESRFNMPGQKATRGFGLHEACELVKMTGGRLVLRSSHSMVTLSGGTMRSQDTNWVFCGTQVSMDVPI